MPIEDVQAKLDLLVGALGACVGASMAYRAQQPPERK